MRNALSTCTVGMVAGLLSLTGAAAQSLPALAFSPLNGGNPELAGALSTQIVERLTEVRHITLVPADQVAAARRTNGLAEAGPVSLDQASVVLDQCEARYGASGELVDLGEHTMANITIWAPARDITRLAFSVIERPASPEAHADKLAKAIVDAIDRLEAEDEVLTIIEDADGPRRIPKDWLRPSVMVVISDEDGSALPTAEAAAMPTLHQRLRGAGFKVIHDVARPAADTLAPLTRESALRRAANRGAQVLVFGSSLALGAAADDQRAHYEARVELHAFEPSTGEALASAQGRGKLGADVPQDAGNEACKEATHVACDRLLYDVAQEWTDRQE